MQDLEHACRACEIHIRILNAAEHQQVKALLIYDKKKKGSKGRSLRANLALPGRHLLEIGDRLEPSKSLVDVGRGFDIVSIFPLMVVF